MASSGDVTSREAFAATNRGGGGVCDVAFASSPSPLPPPRNECTLDDESPPPGPNDDAIDGYTIEFLDRRELGLANGIRIAVSNIDTVDVPFVNDPDDGTPPPPPPPASTAPVTATDTGAAPAASNVPQNEQQVGPTGTGVR